MLGETLFRLANVALFQEQLTQVPQGPREPRFIIDLANDRERVL